MDVNSDGDLSKEEMAQFYGADLSNEKAKKQIDQQWEKVDPNHAGSITLAEFERIQMPVMKQAAKAHLAKRQQERHSNK